MGRSPYLRTQSNSEKTVHSRSCLAAPGRRYGTKRHPVLRSPRHLRTAGTAADVTLRGSTCSLCGTHTPPVHSIHVTTASVPRTRCTGPTPKPPSSPRQTRVWQSPHETTHTPRPGVRAPHKKSHTRSLTAPMWVGPAATHLRTTPTWVGPTAAYHPTWVGPTTSHTTPMWVGPTTQQHTHTNTHAP